MDNIITFQLTTSRRGRQSQAVKDARYALGFQLTTSRRGRLHKINYTKYYKNFNSRPHEEVDSFFSCIILYNYVFQLTTSRRGRRCRAEYGISRGLFQLTTSRRGRLVSEYFISDGDDISTHDLTKRSTNS